MTSTQPPKSETTPLEKKALDTIATAKYHRTRGNLASRANHDLLNRTPEAHRGSPWEEPPTSPGAPLHSPGVKRNHHPGGS